MDIPQGRLAEPRRLVQAIARRLNVKVSESQLSSDTASPIYAYGLHYRGITMDVEHAEKDGDPHPYMHTTTFNPHRLQLNVRKTGFQERAPFDEVVTAARDSANQLGWPFSKGAADDNCST